MTRPDKEGVHVTVMPEATLDKDVVAQSSLPGLFEGNQVFQGILEANLSPMAVLDTECCYLVFNQAYAKEFTLLFGLELTPGADLIKLLARVPGALKDVRLVMRRAKQGDAFTAELDLGDFRRARNLYHLSFSPVLAPSGRLVGMSHTVHNLTEIRRQENELLELKAQLEQRTLELSSNQQMLQEVLEGSNDGYWSWDASQKHLFLSLRCYELLGYPPMDLGTTLPRLGSWLHPDDLASAETIVNTMTSEAGGARQYEVELRLRTAQGSYRWVLIRGKVSARLPNGRPLRVSGAATDITARKEAEERLRENEGHLRRVMNSLFAFVGVLTPEGILIESNRAPLEAAGITLAEVRGKRYEDCYWWNYSTEAQRQLRAALDRAAAGEVCRYDTRVRIRGDQLITVDFMVAPMRDDQGRITHLIPSAVDITDRKLAEQAMRDSEERYRSLTRAITSIVWTTNADGEFESPQRHWEEYTGHPWEVHQGHGWTKALHPEDRARVHVVWRHAVQSRAAFYSEGRVWHAATRGYRYFEARGVPIIDSRGQVREWIGTFMDVHDRVVAERALRASEERLAMAQRAGRVGVFDWDMQSGRIIWTTQLEEIFGLAPGSFEGTYEAWTRRVIPEDLYRWERLMQEWLREKQFEVTVQYRCRLPDGQVRWLDTHAQLIYNMQGQVLRMVGTKTDITARKQAEEALSQSREQLERLVADRTARLRETISELERFSYSISHDMRAPLRAMQGYARALVEDYAANLPAEAQDYLQRIVTASIRQDRLIQDVLSYSRVIRQAVQLEPVDLHVLVREVIQQYPNLQPPALELDIPEPLTRVMGHPALLTQCLSNLLGNAEKFVAPGVKPVTRIWTEPLGAHVRLWVEDNGIGIAPEDQQRIFGMFERIHSPKDYDGTGIGLAIVRKAVERMNGEVGVESQLGKGSRFWIKLLSAEPNPE